MMIVMIIATIVITVIRVPAEPTRGAGCAETKQARFPGGGGQRGVRDRDEP